jgi:hypothetical protein
MVNPKIGIEEYECFTMKKTAEKFQWSDKNKY